MSTTIVLQQMGVSIILVAIGVFLYMKSILEYLNKNTFENRLGEIRFELDEESCKYFLLLK